MTVAVYYTPLGSVNAMSTGVGQHIAHMAAALGAVDQVSKLTLLASRGAYRRHRAKLPDSLQSLPVRFTSWPEGFFRRIQMMTTLFPMDRWADGADWIYCPKEQPVAAGKCRLAVMVHDVAALEPAIPGMPPAQGWLVRRWRMAMKRIIDRAHLIATASEFTAQRIRELCGVGDDRRLCVIGNGVSAVYLRGSDAGDTAVLDRFGLAGRAYVLAVGSLTWRKGGDTLLELAQLIAREREDLRIIVSGRRHDAELVERMTCMKREQPNLPIDLIGYVPDQDLAGLYRGARAFVFPSRYEGFGIPVLEAMACGTPVICSNAAALPELAGDVAIQISPGSAPGILEAIRRLDGRAGGIERGRVRAATFTWERCARRLVEGMAAVDARRGVQAGGPLVK